MADPKSAQEYEEKFHRAENITGYGVFETTMHMPCPFCAEADWMVFLVIESPERMVEEATCSACGRSGKFLMSGYEGNVSYEFVQTGGSPPPQWLTPPPRRV
jgi:hypothetical protein